MTHDRKISAISSALDSMADVADEITGEERTQLVAIMQDLADLYEIGPEIGQWLADCTAYR